RSREGILLFFTVGRPCERQLERSGTGQQAGFAGGDIGMRAEGSSRCGLRFRNGENQGGTDMVLQKDYKFWFCTGSQDLYGEECLQHVAEHSAIIVDRLNQSGILPFEVVLKPTLITNEVIRRTFNEANTDKNCAGVIVWCHTFSPAKSWILGLQEYRKPLLHLHTQFNQEIPYDTIDMDFMNENQAAHGDREWGHMVTRMGIERKVVVGHWSDER